MVAFSGMGFIDRRMVLAQDTEGPEKLFDILPPAPAGPTPMSPAPQGPVDGPARPGPATISQQQGFQPGDYVRRDSGSGPEIGKVESSTPNGMTMIDFGGTKIEYTQDMLEDLEPATEDDLVTTRLQETSKQIGDLVEKKLQEKSTLSDVENQGVDPSLVENKADEITDEIADSVLGPRPSDMEMNLFDPEGMPDDFEANDELEDLPELEEDSDVPSIKAPKGKAKASLKRKAEGNPTTVDMDGNSWPVDAVIGVGWQKWWEISIYTGAGVDSFTYLVNANNEQDALDELVDSGNVDRFQVSEEDYQREYQSYLKKNPDGNEEDFENNLSYYFAEPMRLGNAGELFDMQILRFEEVGIDQIHWGDDKPQEMIDEEADSERERLEDEEYKSQASLQRTAGESLSDFDKDDIEFVKGLAENSGGIQEAIDDIQSDIESGAMMNYDEQNALRILRLLLNQKQAASKISLASMDMPTLFAELESLGFEQVGDKGVESAFYQARESKASPGLRWDKGSVWRLVQEGGKNYLMLDEDLESQLYRTQKVASLKRTAGEDEEETCAKGTVYGQPSPIDPIATKLWKSFASQRNADYNKAMQHENADLEPEDDMIPSVIADILATDPDATVDEVIEIVTDMVSGADPDEIMLYYNDYKANPGLLESYKQGSKKQAAWKPISPADNWGKKPIPWARQMADSFMSDANGDVDQALQELYKWMRGRDSSKDHQKARDIRRVLESFRDGVQEPEEVAASQEIPSGLGYGQQLKQAGKLTIWEYEDAADAKPEPAPDFDDSMSMPMFDKPLGDDMEPGLDMDAAPDIEGDVEPEAEPKPKGKDKKEGSVKRQADYKEAQKAVRKHFYSEMPPEISQGINLLSFTANFSYADPSDIWTLPSETAEGNIDDPDSPWVGKTVQETMDAVQDWLEENVPDEVFYDSQSGEVLTIGENALEAFLWESAKEMAPENVNKEDFIGEDGELDEEAYEQELEEYAQGYVELGGQDYYKVDHVKRLILGDANEYLGL